MKRILFLLAWVPLLWSANAAASPCPLVGSSLTAYIAFGLSGCTIGNATFSGFGTLQQPASADAEFASIFLTPFSSGSTVGLDFRVTRGILPSSVVENLIKYRVTGNATAVTGVSATLNDSLVDSGQVTLVENYCLGGTFAPDGLSLCSGTGIALIAYDYGFDASLTEALGPFAPGASFLSVVSDIAIDSTGGPASLSSFSNRFVLGPAATTTVPEPGAVLLLGAGLLAALVGKRRRR